MQNQQAKPSEGEKALENEKSGTQTGHTSSVSHFPEHLTKPKKEANRLPKTSVEYWKAVVAPRLIRGTPSAELYVRFRESGRDAWVNLDALNKITAATKARDLWLNIRAKGLDVALAEFRPKSAPRPEQACTVGEFITAARALCSVRQRTLAQYETSLRRVVAGVTRLDGDASRFDYKSGGSDAWRAKVEAVRLDRITPAAVEAWRIAWASEAVGEVARKARQHSASTYIRNARSLFSVDLLAVLRERLRLPELLPFTGLSAAASARRFTSTVDPRALYAAAWCDLAPTPDTLTAFLLLITGGLRRAEADLLPWAHLDLTNDTPAVRIEATEHFLPKTEESARDIPLPEDVARFLRARRLEAPEAEFVLNGTAPKTAKRTNTYRAEAWEPLTAWIRTKGITGQKPLHELRKLSGSLVNATAGIEAARRHLGHANITTTSNSYVSARTAVVDLAAKP